jgi:hypothetical protein
LRDGILMIPGSKWEDNIQMDLREMECKVKTGFSWPRLGPNDRTFMNFMMNLQILK